MQRQTSPPMHTTCASRALARLEEVASPFLGNRASLEPPEGRPQPPSLDYCSREKYMHTICRNAALSTLGDGETAFQMSDTIRSAAYPVTKQECCLQVSN